MHLVDDLSGSADRISRLLDVVEAVPPRVVAVLDEADPLLHTAATLDPAISTRS